MSQLQQQIDAAIAAETTNQVRLWTDAGTEANAGHRWQPSRWWRPRHEALTFTANESGTYVILPGDGKVLQSGDTLTITVKGITVMDA